MDGFNNLNIIDEAKEDVKQARIEFNHERNELKAWICYLPSLVSYKPSHHFLHYTLLSLILWLWCWFNGPWLLENGGRMWENMKEEVSAIGRGMKTKLLS